MDILWIGGLLIPWIWSAGLALVPAKMDRFARLGACVGSLLTAILISVSLLGSPASEATEPMVAIEWLPAIGLNFLIIRDGLTAMFQILIVWISVLVALYAWKYLPDANKKERSERSEASFYSLMSAFTGAMLGLVTSGNLLQFYLFWELTGIASYLLIGYWNHQEEARKGALLALGLTVAGGVAMLVGFFWLGTETGLWNIPELLGSSQEWKGKLWLEGCAGLVVIGALAKSAQFPFMSWLPAAMNAPTPVSAFLHSSALVAAGVYLLARFHLLLHTATLWYWFLIIAGGIGAVYGGLLAVRQEKLKPLLAYSTISQYAFMFIGFGMGTKGGFKAALYAFFIHAFLKAGLFLVAGSVTHVTGDKELKKIGGLIRSHRVLAVLGVILGLSIAGIPLTGKFYYEEELLKAVVEENHSLIIYAVFLAGGMLSLIYMLRFLTQIFLGKNPKDEPLPPVPTIMGFPIGVMAAAAVLTGLSPDWMSGSFLTPALAAGLQGPVQFHVELKIGPIFWSSVASLVVGAILWTALSRCESGEKAWHLLPKNFALGGARAMAGYGGLSRGLLLLHTGDLRFYLRFILICFLGLTALLWVAVGLKFDSPSPPFQPELSALLLLTVITAGATIFVRHHLTFVIILTITGFALGGAFLFMGAPNIALAQILVETLIDLSIMLALRESLMIDPDASVIFGERKLEPGRWAIALGFGAIMAFGTYWATQNYPSEAVGQWYTSEGFLRTGAEDFVAAILTDFRALDTMVEVLVFTAALLAVIGLFWHEKVTGE